MKETAMKINVQRINMFIVKKKSVVHDERIPIVVMVSSTVRIIQMKKIANNVPEIKAHFYVIRNVFYRNIVVTVLFIVQTFEMN